tara:strand:+ start:1698 stop:2015 length:318 start_codon:yes stop_codon:yes gene_type:complete
VNDEIDYILETFNFDRVHVAMTALDWKWSKQNIQPSAVPTIARLKLTAKMLLETACKEQTTICTGGLQAKYYPPIKDSTLLADSGPILSLNFVLTETNSEDYTDD